MDHRASQVEGLGLRSLSEQKSRWMLLCMLVLCVVCLLVWLQSKVWPTLGLLACCCAGLQYRAVTFIGTNQNCR